jgi:hypothetical protein
VGSSRRVPARAGRTLPSFWIGDRLIAVPHLGFEQDDATRGLGLSIRFAPPGRGVGVEQG